MDAYSLGLMSVELGAGRRAKEDHVDPAAGFILHKKIGDYTKRGETLCTLHTNNRDVLDQCKDTCNGAITIRAEVADVREQITHKVDKNGVHKYER